MPAGELATVLVRLTADASDFISKMDQANDSLKDFAIGAAGLTAAGTLIGAALTGAAEYASKYETGIFNLSQRTGIATETISALSLAASAQGKTLESVEVAFRKLGLEAENASLGQKKAVEVFNAIGVSVRDSSGRLKELSDLFPEVNEGLSKVGNSTLQVGLANDLYGRSSLTLLPVLGSGIDKLNQFAEVATRTGVMVTESQAEQGKAFQLTQLMAENAFKGLVITVGNLLLPSLADFAKGLEADIEAMSKLVAAHPILVDAVANLTLALVGTGGLLLAISGVISALNLLTATAVTTGAAMAGFAGMFAILGSLAYTFRFELAEIITAIGSKLASALASVIGPLATLAGKAGMDGLRDSIMGVKFSLEESSKQWADQSEQFSHTVTISTDLDAALKLMMASLKGVGDGHLDGKDKVDKFRQAVDSLVDSVTHEIKSGPVLVAALAEMTNEHINQWVIVDKLGKKVEEYREALERDGKTVDALTMYYSDLYRVRENAIGQTEQEIKLAELTERVTLAQQAALVAYVSEYASGHADMARIDAQYLGDFTAKINASREFLQATYKDEVKDKLDAINQSISADTTYAAKLRDLTQASTQMKKSEQEAYSEFVFANEYLITMSEHDANAEQLKDLQDKLNKKLITWQKFSDEVRKLDGETARVLEQYWAHFYTSQEQAQQNMEFGMAGAMRSLTDNIASELARDIVHWSGWASSLAKIATDVSQQMLQAFMRGLLNPLTNALEDLGKTIADKLSGAVGGGGGIGGGLLSGLSGIGGAIPVIGGAIALGGLLGGLLGGGEPKYTHFQVNQHDGGWPVNYNTGPMTLKDAQAYFHGGTVMGYYEQGTPYVPQTGPYQLHQGEGVLNANDNKNMSSLLASILGVLQSAGGDLVMNVDGREVARIVGVNQRYLTYNSGLQTVASR